MTSVLQQQKSANKGKKLLRKFRIAGYVVFFSLFLPKYTQLFTKKRLDKHKKLFYSNTVDQYEQYSSQMQLLLVDINFLEALPEPSESQEVKSSH